MRSRAANRTARYKLATLGLASATALALVTAAFALPTPAYAQTSAGQSDPAWDFGRGGQEVPGQPACYMPAPNMTERKMYNLHRPSCYPYHMQ